MRLLLVGAATALVLLATIHAAAAQNAAQAESLFKQAKQLQAGGKLVEACDLFAASQRLDPSPATLMNVANCREKSGAFASAWEAYVSVERQVRGDPRYGKMGELAGARAATLEARLSYLTINVADEVRIDGLEVTRDGVVIEPGAWNRALPVDGGKHTIAGRAPGHETWSTAVTIAPEDDKQQVEVPKFKALRNPTGRTIVIEQQAPAVLTGRRKVALGVVGAGVAATVVGVVFGLASARADDQARALCTDVACDEYQRANQLGQTSRDRALYANVGYAVGGVAVATAVVLWLTGSPRERASQPRLSAQVGARQLTASVALHF